MSSPQILAQSSHQQQHQQHQLQQQQLQQQQQRLGGNLATHTTTNQSNNPHGFAVRPTLPDRDVTSATIEDALSKPAKKWGKLFCPFIIFDLVRKFYEKEIKTWTELTTRLGVEPPDPGKDESAQKIAQYGVRLKKWMNSMHIKAFFEYLMNIPNEYWTKIPDDPNPISQAIRDGIAVEDDMALRALLPHIRPKRGRKRPDDESLNSPAQRQRLSPPSAIDGPQGPWSAHPDPRAPQLSMDPSRSGGAVWGLHDPVPTPINKWPNSAATPTARSAFWEDALEPRSAVTPSKQKIASHRRGAKNVSSAWKPSGSDPGSAKTRGRPPMNRASVEAPNHPSAVSWAPTPDSNPAELKEMMPITPNSSQVHIPLHSPVSSQTSSVQTQVQAGITPPNAPLGTPTGMGSVAGEAGRPSRPNISLQVPERQGGSVRLASPPMMVMNGQQGYGTAPPPQPLPPHGGLRDPTHTNGWRSGQDPSLPPPPQPPSTATETTAAAPAPTPASAAETNGTTTSGQAPAPPPPAAYVRDVPEYYFEGMDDRTNMDPLISYFTHVLHNADWVDPEGNRQEPAGMEECTAMTNATVEHMYKSAESSQAFLINLAALAGAKMLMTSRPKCHRVETSKDIFTYYFDWQYRFGNLKGQFTMTHSVPLTMWKKKSPEEAAETSDQGDGTMPNKKLEPLTSEQWQVKYRALMDELERRDQELFDMQTRVMKSLK
ncbi:ARS-binding protein 2 [Cladobotryum mycophilum]|uniref:ARS-binding protein 2 n=1 Tax=Cladobotryum mycophilum TaxID=491253 RepID=A0ABR0T0U9_9HYPO